RKELKFKTMKKMLVFIGAALLVLMGADQARAQEGVRLTLGYNINMPSGTFKDFMGQNSYRGFGGEVTYPLNANFRIGLGVAHSDYYEKTARQVYETKD